MLRRRTIASRLTTRPALIDDAESSADEIPFQKTSADGANEAEDNEESGADNDDAGTDECVTAKQID
jgi:hypothetical protein